MLIGSLPIAGDLEPALLKLQCEVETHSMGDTALQAWSQGRCEAAVFWISFQDAQPFAAVTTFRERHTYAPIVIVSDLTNVDHRVAGLDAGANDYITVPFAIAELRARLRAITRNTSHRPAEIRIGHLRMRAGDLAVTIGTQRIELSPRETKLLEMLAMSFPDASAKAVIANRFSAAGPASHAAVEIAVFRLRRRLTPYGMNIVTLRGVGYRLHVTTDAVRSSQ